VRKVSPASICKRLTYSLSDLEGIYYFAYVLLTIVALWNPFFYAVLLLDIVRRSDDLVNILRSITENYKQLLLTLLLGVIIVFLFAVSGFLWFGEYFQDSPSSKNLYCQSLLQCFLTILNFGVRAGGGVGDVLKYPLISDAGYWYRQVYDILFFIVVSIVLLNIIFGIIIDTFGDLRDKRQFIENDLQTVCFICGRQLFEFEYKGKGWNEHIQIEHNLYAYLAFIIYLRSKPLEECDGLEKFVKKKITQNDVSFFPKTARSLKETEEEEEKSAMDKVKAELQSLVESMKASKE
jgi:inositol 1,4,5-triphosphate receptor type 1